MRAMIKDNFFWLKIKNYSLAGGMGRMRHTKSLAQYKMHEARIPGVDHLSAAPVLSLSLSLHPTPTYFSSYTPRADAHVATPLARESLCTTCVYQKFHAANRSTFFFPYFSFSLHFAPVELWMYITSPVCACAVCKNFSADIKASAFPSTPSCTCRFFLLHF